MHLAVPDKFIYRHVCLTFVSSSAAIQIHRESAESACATPKNSDVPHRWTECRAPFCDLFPAGIQYPAPLAHVAVANTKGAR